MTAIGRSRSPDAVEAGSRAALDALAGLSPGSRPCWAMAFCGGKHDPQAIMGALRAVLGDLPIVGGSAAGTITRGGAGYSGFEVAVALVPEPSPTAILAETIAGAGDSWDEHGSGRRLGARIREAVPEGGTVLMFYDSVAVEAPLRLHPASSLVEGIYEGLGDRQVHLVGGGTLTDMNLTGGYVFDGQGVAKHVAVAVVLPPEIRAETIILHGCIPVSTFMKVTRVEGAEVFELDGRPALDVIEGMLNMKMGGGGDALSLLVTLGEKHGDPFAPYDENAYVNRLILFANPERRSLTLFEPDFQVGSTVQIMSRDNGLMLESVRRGAEEMGRRCAGRDGLLSLYIDCAGRASARSGASTEEADVLLDALSVDAPLIGFYSGVEIAPVNGRSRPLDWTGVLTTLYRQG